MIMKYTEMQQESSKQLRKLYIKFKAKFLMLSLYKVLVLTMIAIGVVRLIVFSPAHKIRYQDFIQRSEVEGQLYKKINHNLKININLPKCNYSDVLNSNKTESTWGHPKIINISTENLLNGSYSPIHCNPEFSVAILVPYFNRKPQMDVFLPNIHDFLRRQNIHYRIYLIEQLDQMPFNKGILYNVGAKQAVKDDFPCLILHDIDLLPLDHCNLYVCTKQPRHMSGRIDSYRFNLLYKQLFGGAVAIRSRQYTSVNGFSHRFYGWGGEDDEFYARVVEKGYQVIRYPPEMARYTIMQHQRPKVNERRWTIFDENRLPQMVHDGMSDLDRYVDTVTVEGHTLYTWVGVRRKLLDFRRVP